MKAVSAAKAAAGKALVTGYRNSTRRFQLHGAVRRCSDRSLLSSREAACEAEDLCRQFEVLYSESDQFITALRGWRTYGMNWFDAHLWSFAEYYRVDEIF